MTALAEDAPFLQGRVVQGEKKHVARIAEYRRHLLVFAGGPR